MNVMETMQSSLTKLIQGQDLSREEARRVMQSIMEGQATHSQIGALLTALRMKGRRSKRSPASPRRCVVRAGASLPSETSCWIHAAPEDPDS